MVLNRAWLRLRRALLNHTRDEQDLEDEIRFHLSEERRLLGERGQTPASARSAARKAFGNIMFTRESMRRVWVPTAVEQLLQDVRHTGRLLARTPGFTLVVVLTLAVGIGANTTIFSVVDAILLRPLPYAEPDRLVTVLSAEPPVRYVPTDVLALWNNQPQVFDSVGGHQTVSRALIAGAEPAFVSGEAVSAGLLAMLGVGPQLGRLFRPEEGTAGSNRVVIISHRLWRSQFAADPGAIGQPVILNGEPHTVIGVMPAGFRYPREAQDFWLSLSLSAASGQTRLEGIGRLRDGLDAAEAREAIGVIANRQSREELGAGNPAISFQPLGDGRLNPGDRRAMFILFGAVGFVLLIAVVNITNLLLSRATAREPEMAMRAAIGASRGRLLRQGLTESLCLAMLGGLSGVLLSIWAIPAIMRTAPTFVTFYNVNAITALNGRVLAFTFAVSVATGIVCGLVPGLTGWRAGLNSAIRRSRGPGSRRGTRVGALLIGSEVILSVVLLVGAGLFMRSFVRLTNVPLGFDNRNVAVATMLLLEEQYRDPIFRDAFFRELTERMEAVPGVLGVTVATSLPPDGNISFDVRVEPEGQTPQSVAGIIGFNYVADNFFEVMGIPILQGRSFGRQDLPGAEPAIIVSRTMAERLWGDISPVGRRVRFGPEEPWRTVVGVAGDLGRQSLDSADYAMDYYESVAQNEWRGQMSLITRTTDSVPIASAIKEQVWALDPGLPLVRIESATEILAGSRADPRFYLILMAIFAVSAVLLAAVGIYGVVAHVVTQRTSEVGIRMSLGAQRMDVLRLILGRVLALSALGVAIGLIGALALVRLLTGLLFDISPTDPATFVASALILWLVALVAGCIPASRATRVDPAVALRAE